MRFQPYPAYKDSGVQWLGQVPAHWDVVPLKHCVTLLTEKSDSRNNPVGLENVESWTGRYVATTSEFAGDGVAFASGDILFGKLRPYLAKVLVARSPGEAVGDFFVMRPNTRLRPDFAQYVMLSPQFISIVDSSTFGSKMPRASWESLGAIPVPLPPTHEQTGIETFLRDRTTEIDALVGELEHLTQVLREKRDASATHATLRGLRPDVSLRYSGVDWIGDVPSHWPIVRIARVARMESGHTPDKKVAAYWENCEIPWVSLNDTSYLKDHDYISDTARKISALGMANSSARLLPPRAVVFSRDATIGRCAITTRAMAVSQHFIAWICGESLLPEYLLLRLQTMSQELDRLTLGATLKTVGMPDVNTLVTPLPPLDEQRDIVRFVSAARTRIDDLIAEVDRAIKFLQERRAALIAATVTGEIDARVSVDCGVA